MPPTTMEGRLFGFLAAAGGMISKSSEVQTSIQNNQSTRLYPNISNLLLDNPCTHIYQPIGMNTSLHCKRLAYLRKIINLLGYAVLCDNSLPLNELDNLL
ncbi:unnamed protein product [Heterobilharzia americana]|nr:unnamed protein product [Heterobilharzia americana]